ncbi:MAG: hypothetical protein H7A49_04005 [Akkermansiaceae bacterium]|nr:hypothetical protein [Akkermansiaceae bacterium]
MTMRLAAGLLALGMGCVCARAEDVIPPMEDKVPPVEDAIPPPVKALGAPAEMRFPGGLQIAVTTTSAEAQKHVNQGLNHLHGGWEFEAARHFGAAMKLDPNCLLAHWGMAMATLTPSPETSEARTAASVRMLELLDQGQGTDLERGYVYGLIKYIEGGPKEAANAFHKVAKQFPNDLQSPVFAALFGRGGYDPSGAPTPDEERAHAELEELVKRFPDSPIPLNALLFVRAEAPDLTKDLPLARKLCRMAPEYPPYFHLLGHYEWRCGDHGEAITAFGRAASFYQNWMKENKVGVADCPEWIKAECYRIVALGSKGDFDTAYAASRQLASTPVPEDRPSSPGARLLLWDAKTLPARILLNRGLTGNAAEAAASLPSPEEIKKFHKHSLAYWWIDGLRFCLDARKQIDNGDLDEARNVVAALTQHGETMVKTRPQAVAGGEGSPWLRSFRALEVLASDLRGLIAMKGPKETRDTAFNWFSSAADRQRPEPMMFPPMVLTPMAVRLGNYHLAKGEPKEALEDFNRALATFPNEIRSLVGKQQACEALGDTAGVEDTAARISRLRGD